MKTPLIVVWMMLGCTVAGCSPGPVPVSQSPRDPSNPSAAEGILPASASAPAAAVEPRHDAPGDEHAHHGDQRRDGSAPAPIDQAATRDAAASAAYACPMHPEVTSSVPGQCPKCGMNLAPRK